MKVPFHPALFFETSFVVNLCTVTHLSLSVAADSNNADDGAAHRKDTAQEWTSRERIDTRSRASHALAHSPSDAHPKGKKKSEHTPARAVLCFACILPGDPNSPNERLTWACDAANARGRAAKEGGRSPSWSGVGLQTEW